MKLLYLYHSLWIKIIPDSRSPNWLNSASARVKTNSSYSGIRMLFSIGLCELVGWILRGLWGIRNVLVCSAQGKPALPAAPPADSGQSWGHKWRSKMAELTWAHSSTELCREKLKAFLNHFFIPIALHLCFRSGIMHEFLKEIVGILDMMFGRENISV